MRSKHTNKHPPLALSPWKTTLHILRYIGKRLANSAKYNFNEKFSKEGRIDFFVSLKIYLIESYNTHCDLYLAL